MGHSTFSFYISIYFLTPLFSNLSLYLLSTFLISLSLYFTLPSLHFSLKFFSISSIVSLLSLHFFAPLSYSTISFYFLLPFFYSTFFLHFLLPFSESLNSTDINIDIHKSLIKVHFPMLLFLRTLKSNKKKRN